MAFLFKKEQPKPTPGFHAIDISSLPDPRTNDPDSANLLVPDAAKQLVGKEEIIAAVRIQAGLRMLRARRTAQGLRGAKVETAAATCLQSFARGAAARTDLARRQQEALEEHAQQHAAASVIQEQHRQNHPPVVGVGGEVGSSSSAEGAMPPADAFVIKNLDTGEAVSVELGSGTEPGKDLKLSFGTLQQNPQAWEALKADSKGLLEKLASSTTLSFRSYQLCVWQERYVYASDDALCYQHLAADMQPTGSKKHIPYSSIEFVGARVCA